MNSLPIGTNDLENKFVPVYVKAMSEDVKVTMVDAGQHHAICLDTAGTVSSSMFVYTCIIQLTIIYLSIIMIY